MSTAPVRTEPLPAPYLGTQVMGKEELVLLHEVIDAKLPFREYGAGTPHMVKDFEREARAYFGAPFALATATGSGSFFSACVGLGLGPGDEVIIPSFAWYTEYTAPVLCGATPVFADIDRSLCIDPADFQRKITPHTKAVIVVHFQGGPADLDTILRIAGDRGIFVIEDIAQACGGAYRGRKLGSLGDVACVSFQQNKILSTGDGGMMLARNQTVFERAVRFHDLGMVRPSLAAQWDGEGSDFAFPGSQFRMNEVTGALALAQLRKLDARVLNLTRRYHARLREHVARHCEGLELRPVGDPDGDAGIAFYMDLETPERATAFGKALSAQGIRIGPSSGCTNLLHEPAIINKQMSHPALPPFGPGWPGEHVTYSADDCPNTDVILQSMVCVALSPAYSGADVDDIAAGIERAYAAVCGC